MFICIFFRSIRISVKPKHLIIFLFLSKIFLDPFSLLSSNSYPSFYSCFSNIILYMKTGIKVHSSYSQMKRSTDESFMSVEISQFIFHLVFHLEISSATAIHIYCYFHAVRTLVFSFSIHDSLFKYTKWKGKYWNMDNTKIGIERGNSYWKNEETFGWKAQVNLTDTFRQSQMSFSIRRQ